MALEYNLRNLTPYFKDYAVSQLTRHSVNDYIDHRLNQPVVIGRSKGKRTVSPSTIKRELDMLGAALNFAKREGLIREVPYFEKPKASKPRERWLTPEEVQKLFTASPTDNLTAFLHVSINTAARPSSVLELKWFQIDLEKRLIHFNPPEREQTKKYRPTVYINDSLLAFLNAWRRKCKSEFVCGGVKSLKKSFRQACMKAKIKGATPYTLRHTAVTWVVRDGFSLALAGQLAGHKDPRTTMRYAKHDPSFTSGVVTALASGAQLAHKIAKSGKKAKTAPKKSKRKQAC
jgi:integrase